MDVDGVLGDSAPLPPTPVSSSSTSPLKNDDDDVMIDASSSSSSSSNMIVDDGLTKPSKDVVNEGMNVNNVECVDVSQSPPSSNQGTEEGDESLRPSDDVRSKDVRTNDVRTNDVGGSSADGPVSQPANSNEDLTSSTSSSCAEIATNESQSTERQRHDDNAIVSNESIHVVQLVPNKAAAAVNESITNEPVTNESRDCDGPDGVNGSSAAAAASSSSSSSSPDASNNIESNLSLANDESNLSLANDESQSNESPTNAKTKVDGAGESSPLDKDVDELGSATAPKEKDDKEDGKDDKGDNKDDKDVGDKGVENIPKAAPMTAPFCDDDDNEVVGEEKMDHDDGSKLDAPKKSATSESASDDSKNGASSSMSLTNDSASTRLASNLSSTISQLAARVTTSSGGGSGDIDEPMDADGDVSMEDDEEEEEEDEDVGEGGTQEDEDDADDSIMIMEDENDAGTNTDNAEKKKKNSVKNDVVNISSSASSLSSIDATAGTASSSSATSLEAASTSVKMTEETAPKRINDKAANSESASDDVIAMTNGDDDDDDVIDDVTYSRPSASSASSASSSMSSSSFHPPPPPPSTATNADNAAEKTPPTSPAVLTTPTTPRTTTTTTTPRSLLTKEQINAIIEQKLQAYVKNLCKTEELEKRFEHLEEWTENLRKKHREQDKTLMKIERTARVGDRRTGCRHVACQTNLGGGSLQAAQKLSSQRGVNAGSGGGGVNSSVGGRGGGGAATSGMNHHQHHNNPHHRQHPNQHHQNLNNSSNNNKRGNQEIVDLTDEDNGTSPSPAVKRLAGNSAGVGHHQQHPYGAANTNASGPHSAALQQLVASGAAKVVTPGSGSRTTLSSSQQQQRTSLNGHQPAFSSSSFNQHSSHNSQQQQSRGGIISSVSSSSSSKHPAPLPPYQQMAMVLGAKMPPPQPSLKIEVVQLQQNRGVMLSWDIREAGDSAPLIPGKYAKIVKYQLYAYQETPTAAPTSSLWKKIGDDVAAMPLPMACTLSHFLAGHHYHFAVRAMDEHQRIGPFSDPQSIYLD